MPYKDLAVITEAARYKVSVSCTAKTEIPNRKFNRKKGVGDESNAGPSRISVRSFRGSPRVAAPQNAASSTSTLPATYVSAADIQANLNGAPNSATNPLPNIRVVDAGGYNVAVGVIHRPQTPPGVVAVHYKVTEIYHVTDGAATLVTGGTMVNAKPQTC